MATSVEFAIPARELGNTGITFKREVNGELHGEITISQNHVNWRPKGGKFIYELTWEKVAAFAVDKGNHIRPKATPVKSRKKLKPRN